MGMSLTYKILKKNLLKGELKAGNEIAVRVNQTLTQDSTGTMAYLQLNAMNVDKVATEISVAYVDHNMLQSSFENADDHEFIKTSAEKHNIVFSKSCTLNSYPFFCPPNIISSNLIFNYVLIIIPIVNCVNDI